VVDVHVFSGFLIMMIIFWFAVDLLQPIHFWKTVNGLAGRTAAVL